MKKFLAILLSAVLMLSLAVPSMAASVTIPDALKDHTFVAYQIFTGTQAASEGALGDVEWGNGINVSSFLAKLQSEATVFGATNVFAGLSEAGDVAKKMATFATDSAAAKLIAKLAYECKTGVPVTLESDTNLDDGYYLIVDNSGGPIDGSGNIAYNAALLQITDDITIRVKTSVPSVEKKVKENVKDVDAGNYGDKYNDVADYNIGDEVPFAFYSKVPDMTYYDTYKYIFHDKMSAGLTLVENTITVKVGNETLIKGTHYTVNTQLKDGCTFEIVIENLKIVPGAEKDAAIRVDFTATLNNNAEIGLPGNPNEVMLEYSNNPNGDGTGKTTWDKVIVFTYEVDVTKVDGSNKDTKLAGAEFVLLNTAKTKVAVVNKDFEVTGWEPVPAADEDWPTGSVLASDDDGLFKVIGLDDGTYYLREIKAPAGYNILTDDIQFEISATTENIQTWTGEKPGDVLTALEIKIPNKDHTAVDTKAGDTTSGIVTATVENNAGSILPETGGIGTTIFYAVGGVMVAAAAILLITKKRMSTEG